MLDVASDASKTYTKRQKESEYLDSDTPCWPPKKRIIDVHRSAEEIEALNKFKNEFEFANQLKKVTDIEKEALEEEPAKESKEFDLLEDDEPTENIAEVNTKDFQDVLTVEQIDAIVKKTALKSFSWTPN